MAVETTCTSASQTRTDLACKLYTVHASGPYECYKPGWLLTEGQYEYHVASYTHDYDQAPLYSQTDLAHMLTPDNILVHTTMQALVWCPTTH